MRAELLVLFVMGLFYSGKKIPFSDVTLITSRNIDVTTQLSKYVLNIKVMNIGDDVSSFVHLLSKEESQHLSYIAAFEGNDRMKKLQVLPLEESFGGNSEYVYYKIEFISALKKDTVLEFQIEYILSDYLKVFPAEISQHQSQYVFWEGSSNYVSVYPIESDVTVVQIGHGKVLSYTGTKTGDKIQYGPTKNIPPFSSNSVLVHYENHAHLVLSPSQDLMITYKWGLIEKWIKPVIFILMISTLTFVCYIFLLNLFTKLRKPYVSIKVK